MTIISDNSCPVTVTRLIAESPPTFTVWQPAGPAAGGTGVDNGPGKWSSSPSELSPEVGEGEGEGVNAGEGEGIGVGVGEDVNTGVGDGSGVGVGDGEAEVVGTVVI